MTPTDSVLQEHEKESTTTPLKIGCRITPHILVEWRWGAEVHPGGAQLHQGGIKTTKDIVMYLSFYEFLFF